MICLKEIVIGLRDYFMTIFFRKNKVKVQTFFFHSESIFMKYANKLMERTCTAFIITNYP